jgi:uncharacterized protein YkvS
MSETAIVNGDFVSKFNPDQILEWVNLGVDILKNVSEVLKKINEKAQSEKLAKVIEKLDALLAMVSKVLDNKSIIDVVLLILKMFTSKKDVSFKDAVMEAILKS